MNKNKKIGYSLISICLIVGLLGTVGYTFEDEVNDLPTPSVANHVFFADDAIPSNPVALFLDANSKITWDRSDIFLVIADVDKKERCESMNQLEIMGAVDECKSSDNEFEALGDDNIEGLEWKVKSDEYYVGVGAIDEIGQDFTMNVQYEVEISISATSYFVLFLISAIGLGIARIE